MLEAEGSNPFTRSICKGETMVVLFQYCLLSLAAFSIVIYTVSCGNGNTPAPPNTSPLNTKDGQKSNGDTSNTDTLYLIRNKRQQKRILYVDKNKKTPLLTLMSPETFCLKIKKSDFNNIQKMGLSSDLQEIDQLICSNEQESEPSSTVPNCELKNYRITNNYRLEPLNLDDPNTVLLLKNNYDPFCFEFVPWVN